MADRYRLMIVEDEEETRQFLQDALRDTFELAFAHDGFDCIENLNKVDPDLIIMDVVMPLMDGFEACQAVRRRPGYENTQIIFLSGKDDQRTIHKSYEVGGNLFVKKPVEAERLIKNIELSLHRSGPPRHKKHPIREISGVITTAPVPKAPKAAPPRKPVEARPAAAPKKAAALNIKARIMVVDDDPEVLQLLDLSLQDAFEVATASNGLQAIERIIDCQPDLLLIDVMMPKMNGYQLCQSLRRNVTYQQTPIVILTAKSNRKDREYAEKCGANAYVTKPFDIASLRELIDELVQKSPVPVRTKNFSLEEIRQREDQDKRERMRQRKAVEQRQRYEDLKDLTREE